MKVEVNEDSTVYPTAAAFFGSLCRVVDTHIEHSRWVSKGDVLLLLHNNGSTYINLSRSKPEHRSFDKGSLVSQKTRVVPVKSVTLTDE